MNFCIILTNLCHVIDKRFAMFIIVTYNKIYLAKVRLIC